VILFGFRAKFVKIVEQNRTEFISQIKKITNSELLTPQAWAARRISRGYSFGGVICLILLSCKVSGSVDPWVSEPGARRRGRV